MVSKHKEINCKNVNDDCKNVNDFCKNVNDDCKNVNDDCKNVNDFCKNVNDDNKCSKCLKILSSKYYLTKHLKICKGISNACECHLCHKIFACYSSKSAHLKICKGTPVDIILCNNNEIIKPLENMHQVISNNQITLNNNCNNTINNTNNNITYNVNLISFNEEELKIDFDISHIVYKLYTIDTEDAFRQFYKKLFENKNNQMIIKKNLKHTYSIILIIVAAVVAEVL
jgi:hypothetical protein